MRDSVPDVHALALQGGGSLGAFSRGVIDTMLEHRVRISAVSGASAGAFNAVMLAQGLMDGPEKARDVLTQGWSRVAGAASFLGESGMRMVLSMWRLTSHFSSPYAANPSGSHPLREILGDLIDFERLRRERPIRIFISATRVSDGKPRIFREHEISAEVIMASSCLPQLHHAVMVGGQEYWDGGYTLNPPLTEIIRCCNVSELTLVQLTPDGGLNTPLSGENISRRIVGLPFMVSLERELTALRDLQLMAETDIMNPMSLMKQRLTHLRTRIIKAGEHMDLSVVDPLDTSLSVLNAYARAGRQAAMKQMGFPPAVPV